MREETFSLVPVMVYDQEAAAVAQPIWGIHSLPLLDRWESLHSRVWPSAPLPHLFNSCCGPSGCLFVHKCLRIPSCECSWPHSQLHWSDDLSLPPNQANYCAPLNSTQPWTALFSPRNFGGRRAEEESWLRTVWRRQRYFVEGGTPECGVWGLGCGV